MTDLNRVKELRIRTGCGIVDCQTALQEANSDIEKAIMILRKKGKTGAAKKAKRATREGIVASYVHSNGKIAAQVSLLCETDFVARNEKFKELAHDIALHIAALDPVTVSPDDIPESVLTEEKSIAVEQAASSGKPADIQEKVIEGKLKKFKAERALLTQPYVKDPNKTVGDLIVEAISELGENISVGEFTRLAV